MKQTTIIFLSGVHRSGQKRSIEDFMRAQPDDFYNTGVLLSFFDICSEKTGQGRTSVRLRRFLEGEFE